MDLLERYLQAVRFFLPKREQEDIVRELSENLISQMEDKAAELGRPLSGDEQADILRRHGHPLVVAGRYRSRQQLIGACFFPIYLIALKIGLGAALAVTVLAAIVGAVLHGEPIQHGIEAMLRFSGRALIVFAWTTLTFAVLDIGFSRLKLKRDWDPRRLPKVGKPEERVSRVHSVSEFIFASACAIWLLLIPRMPFLALGPAAGFVEPAPIWSVVYVPILLLTLAAAALSLVNFLQPLWRPARSVARMVIHGATLAVWTLLLRAGEWVTAVAGATLPDGGSVEPAVSLINAGCQIAAVAVCLLTVIEIAREGLSWRARRKPFPVPAGTPARAGR